MLSKTATQGIGVRLTHVCPRHWTPPVKFEKLEVPRDCVGLDRLLGAGCFGEVYSGLLYGTIKVAVKKLKLVQDADKAKAAKTAKAFLDEAKVMHLLSHRHIVQILGLVSKDYPVLLLTEYVSNGALLDYLHNHKDELHRVQLVNIVVDVRHCALGRAPVSARTERMDSVYPLCA